MNLALFYILTSLTIDNSILTMSEINCMVSDEHSLVYECLPDEEEIERVSEELEEITLRHPELVWEPIEV